MKRPFAGLLMLACLGLVPTAQASSLKKTAIHLAKAMAHAPNRKVAVLLFPYHDGSISSGSSIISEHMTMLLADRPEVVVVERSLLSKVMEEEKLEFSGIVDPATTRKLGKVLGVDAVVSGTLIDLENGETEVNARLIETQTGAVLAAGTTRVERTWKDLPRLPAPVAVAIKPVAQEATLPVNASPAIFTPTALPLPTRPEEVLVLTNDDLVPFERTRAQHPEQIVDTVIQEDAAPNIASPPAPEVFHIARRVYQRHPNPEVRAKALYAMGSILQRQRQPELAKVAYRRLEKEFPHSALAQQAHNHLTP